MGCVWNAAAGLALVGVFGWSSVCAAELDYSQSTRLRHVDGNIALARVNIPVNKSSTVHVDETFNDILIGSNEIVDVTPLNHHEIYVLGKKIGTTSISVLGPDKHVVRLIDVTVGLDRNDIAAQIRAGLGSSTISVQTRGNKIVLGGVAADAATVDRAVQLANSLVPDGGGVINLTRVASPQQVLLHVRLVELNRNAAREFGVRWEYSNSGSGVRIGHVGEGVRVSDLVPAVATATLEQSLAPPFGQILGKFTGNSQQLDGVISALEQKGLARLLAEPNLVALSGDTADFLAGGEYPVPVASTTQGGVPTITVQFKEFGVRLNFTPTVLNNKLINLRLEPEVSEIDPSVSINTGTVTIPGLSKRRAKTTVELRDGQSFAIAGLLQSTSHSQIEQFPWLGSIPVVGALLRSTAFQQKETELVVIVTPHLVRPAPPNMVLKTPLDTTAPSNDVDLFLLGETERKKRHSVTVERYVPAEGTVSGPHGHILPVPAPASHETPVPIVPIAELQPRE
jgi:pilus assembly protein CpaC